jgi:hypothetical protein
MCWKDEEKRKRICSLCGKRYYGKLGHKNCPVIKDGEIAKKEPIILVLPKDFLRDFREED